MAGKTPAINVACWDGVQWTARGEIEVGVLTVKAMLRADPLWLIGVEYSKRGS